MGTTMTVLAAPAFAQDATPSSNDGQTSAGAEFGSEILVTARRREESVQDVPQVVNVVTADTIGKLNIQRFEEVQSLVPGLTLQSTKSGFTAEASVRGVSYDSLTSANPTVEFYVNDALIVPQMLFQSLYDIGQLEVLRGPQGTLRGRASPSGSIIVTTRRPDLDGFGGYANGTATSEGGYNVNGALNIPIIKDVLAVRVAGIYDENEVDKVRSIRSTIQPFSQTKAGRVSVRFEPSDALAVNVVYSHLARKLRGFNQVESISLSQGGAPVSPMIRGSDRFSNMDGTQSVNDKYDILTGDVNWEFAGQKLTYVGSYSRWQGNNFAAQDAADVFPGQDFYQNTQIDSRQYTHELRLASVDRLAGIFDYSIGAFHSKMYGPTNIIIDNALGAPGFLAGTIPSTITNPGSAQKEWSFFGNLTAHIGEKTEISAGVRKINFTNASRTVFENAAFGPPIELQNIDNTYHPTVYNISLSHRFSDTLMVYANTGSSWRAGPSMIGITRPLGGTNLGQFINLQPETSKSYEIGVKSSFLDNQLTFNVAGFHQVFKNYIFRSPSVPYVNQQGGVDFIGRSTFLANVPAEVNGVEVEAGFGPSRTFSLRAQFSYVTSKLKNGRVPCDNGSAGGNPIAFQAMAGGQVAVCNVTQRLPTLPQLNMTLQPEVTQPLTGEIDAYARGLFTFYGNNPNVATNAYDNVDAYGLLNLYLGVRSGNGAWEASLFGKNLTNTGPGLSRGDSPTQTTYNFATVADSSYVSVRYTAPREFGINLRYSFGTR